MRGIDFKIARIRQRRRQLEIAKTSGVHPTRLSRIENEWEQPRSDEVSAICAALGINEPMPIEIDRENEKVEVNL